MNSDPIFRDRADAGRKLARLLAPIVRDPAPLVLGLPRGGVPTAFEVSQALRAELDVFLVRKLGVPGQEELAIGAIASGGIRVLNDDLIRELKLSPVLIEEITLREEQELHRREELYRQGRPALQISGRTIILVDDGLATGASMKAAAQAVRLQNPKRIIIAVPIASRETCDELRRDADEIVCAFTPAPLVAVGVWYQDFSQTPDEEVRRLLKMAEQSVAGP